MRTVKAVTYINGYRLLLLFDDKKTKIVDLSNVIKNGGYYFKPLQDIELFKQVSLDDEEYPSSIRWPNDADFCPDVLYEMGVDVKEEKKASPKVRSSFSIRQLAPALSKRKPKKRQSP